MCITHDFHPISLPPSLKMTQMLAPIQKHKEHMEQSVVNSFLFYYRTAGSISYAFPTQLITSKHSISPSGMKPT